MNDQSLPVPDNGADIDAELPDLVSGLSLKKKMLVAALIKSFGNITQACDVVKIGRRTYHHWMKVDPIFREVIESEEFEEQKKDFAELTLMQNIQSKKEISTIFFLKTKAKDRGYVEKIEVDHGKMDPGKKPSWFIDEQKALPDTSAFEPGGFEEAEIVSETKNNQL